MASPRLRLSLIAVFVLISGVFSFADEEIKILNDGTKYLIHPSEIRSGGPPPDGIPSIDKPLFESVNAAGKWLGESDLVIILDLNNTVRIYPFPILVWHEIVNDTVQGVPVLVTYCPLCGSAIAYERKIDGESVEFGTSGKLYNSNLIMYDRLTESYWTQIGGRAVVGPLTGARLKPIVIHTVTWADAKARHPRAEVLSRDTGFRRVYGTDPYGSYYTEEYLMFPVDNEDRRLHPKDPVLGIEVDGIYKAYGENDFSVPGKIIDEFEGRRVEITTDEYGVVTFADLSTDEEIVAERDFWFAWAAFHPDTLLYSHD
ncbi:MAG: DUF3179 domain-containing protein [Spirochaetales bacterium]|jgi:hypothetical protein|nr:DUF3179 domain-containing protein [Spirochaetales bacterium]